jgi:hypothetical protein
MRNALIKTDDICKKYGVPFVITSTADGMHSPGSIHYYGLAFDMRNYWWLPKRKLKMLDVYKELKSVLDGYDVIWEKNHIHIEYKRFKSLFRHYYGVDNV